MSPIKFEENIKKELEKRAIPVTEGTWKKLQERLDPEPKKKPKTLIWVLGVAASLAVFFWLSKSVFERSIIEPTIVEEPKEKIEPAIEVEEHVLEPEKSEVLIASKSDKNTIEKSEEPIIKNEIVVDDSTELQPDEVLVAVILEEVKPMEELDFEDQKVHEVVAQIIDLKEQNSTVSDAEIDALLKQAQREIEVKKLLIENASTQNAGTVNPDMLLYEVEMELNKSFRDKVFKELKIQFNSVKNAVAQRNN